MPHSRSYSEIEWPSGYMGSKRRASSDMGANVNGLHSSKSVRCVTAVFSCAKNHFVFFFDFTLSLGIF